MKRWPVVIAGIAGLLLLAWFVGFLSKPTAPAALGKKWHEQVYSLDEDEVERFVPPPYSPGRMERFGRSWAGTPPRQTGQLSYRVINGKSQNWGMSSSYGTLLSALDFCNGLTRADLDLAGNLGGAKADGDWIARTDAPVERRMKALESILSRLVALDLTIEKRMVERDVIVVRGKWEFHPVEGSRDKKKRAVHFYTDKLDPEEGAGGGSGKFPELMYRLEEIARRKVIDETSERPKDTEWYNNYSEFEAHRSEKALELLLENLSKQTGLEFVRTRRMMPIWFIEDKAATTRPAGGP